MAFTRSGFPAETTLQPQSGIVPGDAAAPQSFIIAVNTTKPIWVFCKQTGHCQAGMVMA